MQSNSNREGFFIQPDPREVVPDYCVECRGDIVEKRHEGTVVCTRCGLVQERLLVSDYSYSSMEVEWAPKKKVTDKVTSRSLKLKSVNNEESKTYKVKSLVNTAISRLNLPTSVREQVDRHHEALKQKEACNNMLTNSVIAVLIIYVCREENIPRDIEAVAEALDISNRHKIDQAYKRLKPFLPKKSLYLKPKQLIDRTCNRLSMPMEILEAAKKVCSLVEE